MPRYFLEVTYTGTNYAGFQVQKNANTIQAEVEKALNILMFATSGPKGNKQNVTLTGSSRTDAGVHANQNFFHFDSDIELAPKLLYNINALLPKDIAGAGFYQVDSNAHCRFDALSRQYRYYIYRYKNPFLFDRGYFYPYTLELEALQAAASVIKNYIDFTTFSKRKTQVKTFICNIHQSEWTQEKDCLVYTVTANRFLRGMVRGLVGTMLKVGRGKLSVDAFRTIIEARDCTLADFSVPPQGLFLQSVNYK